MANNCYYLMHVYGEHDKVNEFIQAMQHKDKYAYCGIKGIYSCKFRSEYTTNGKLTCVCEGDCAYSVLSAMRNDSDPNNIEKLSDRLHLDIEVYSYECGTGFEEHYAICDGDIMVDECIDSYEWYVDDIDDDFFENEDVIAAGITKDNYKDFVVDDYIRVGGYNEWNFEYVL